MGAEQHDKKLSREQTEALGEQIAQYAAHLDAATHRLLTDLRTFDREGGWFTQGATSCAVWLAWRVGWSNGTAREHLRVANRLAALPKIDNELRSGKLSYCKVRALTRVATPTNEALLLEDARHSTGEQLEQICRKYAAVRRTCKPNRHTDMAKRRVTRRELDDGMVKIEATLPPDEAMIVWEALSRVARERAAQRDTHTETPRTALAGNDNTPAPDTVAVPPPRFSRADSLVEMSQDVLRGTSPERTPVEVVVTIAADALARSNPSASPVASGLDGTLLSIETVRRLSCDAGIVVMLEDAQGQTIDVGRKTRSIHTALKRALYKRDQTCRFPGCNHRQFLDAHHCVHWANGGQTNPENTALFCRSHHPYFHEYGFTVVLDANQQPIITDPRGRTVVAAPPTAPSKGVPDLRDLNRSLMITANTNMPRWDGAHADYGLIVEGLLRKDGFI